VTFVAGSSTVTKTVNVLNDTGVETNETVVLTLAPGTAYVIGSPSNATVTIQDDDATVTVTATDPLAGEPGTGHSTGTFTFTRTGFTGGALTVNFTVGGTATSGSDYTSIGSNVTFAAGSSTAAKTVSVLDETLVESNETVVVTLAAGTGYVIGSPSNATVTIQDDDATTITVAATDQLAGEPGTGHSTGTFTFTRTGFTGGALTVNFTVGGTATSGSDYTSIGTNVTFVAGSSTAAKTVSVLDDTGVETNETVIVTLAAKAGYVIGLPSSATVTIQSDDPPVTSHLVGNPKGVLPVRITVSQNGHVHLSVSGRPGQHYQILASENLVDWTVVGAEVANEAGSVEFSDENGTESTRRFYRVTPQSATENTR
jgi:hypothetical protein